MFINDVNKVSTYVHVFLLNLLLDGDLRIFHARYVVAKIRRQRIVIRVEIRFPQTISHVLSSVRFEFLYGMVQPERERTN